VKTKKKNFVQTIYKVNSHMDRWECIVHWASK